jgi:dipeptidyl aminopeptidase/acylaminoacyl peptidase
MQKDIRETALYQEMEALFTKLRQPGSGQLSDAAEAHVSPDGRDVVFTGTLVDALEGALPTRICSTDTSSGDTRVLTFGPNTDRSSKFSPNGGQVAFLSDRKKAGDFQLYLLNPSSGAVRPTPPVEGWVEYLHWSPNGKRVLLGVAGHGADVAGGQGAVTSKQRVERPSWMPAVETGDESYRWRRSWVYDLESNEVRQVDAVGINIWEACWCGNDAIAAISSDGPGESLWYSAKVRVIDIETGNSREILTPSEQLGWPAGSPSGSHIAIVESTSSDRGIVAGDLKLIETRSGKVQQIDTRGVDVTHTEWRSDRHLLVAGHRGFDTVVGLCESGSATFREVWCSTEITTGGRYITVSGFGDLGDCVLVGESFTRAPEIGRIREGAYQTVKSFDLGYGDEVAAIGAVERVSWQAPDGLQIQGWLVRPKGQGPHPLVMHVHGGPVWHWRPVWLGRSSTAILMLIKRGHAVFYPNPRGSIGRGQDFIRPVYGDMGGADAQDLLSGLDMLVSRGVADPKRLGVTGGSYGGFMTSWLVTQDPRFAAAVPTFPHNNQVTCRLIGNIPHFMDLIMEDTYNNPGGHYFERSPIMHAHKVKTPTLNICGALDRCTPPEEAVQFHNALLENGAKSVVVTYPEEGHGIRKFPAAIDYATRIVAWFEAAHERKDHS